jgi:hypothetical protein
MRFIRTGIIALAVITVVVLIAKKLDFIGWQRCDTAGQGCCAPDGEVNTKHCHNGLGCNITTGKCEPCGAPGEPCCDGDLTGFTLKGYSGFVLDPKERVESCDPGATCDAKLGPDKESWIGSRVCQACGMRNGGTCCAPDVRYGLGQCFTDVPAKKRLVCADPWAGERGICVQCGHAVGQPACLSGYPCDDNLVEQNGVCVICGTPGAPTCDRGEPCPHQSVPNKSYSMCVAAGGPNQPCLPNRDCDLDGTFCNEVKICQPCGNGGEPCCPPEGGAPCRIGECTDGRCFICGYQNMPVCPGPSPCQGGLEPVDGYCRPCGKAWQPCCYGISIRCDDGMRCEDRVCQGPTQGGGGGTGEQWKTCSGQNYTWTTGQHVIYIENAEGCITFTTITANSPEEAMTCARNSHGDGVIGPAVGTFQFAVTCPYTSCNQVTYSGRDHDSAQGCVEATYDGCTVEDGACP